MIFFDKKEMKKKYIFPVYFYIILENTIRACYNITTQYNHFFFILAASTNRAFSAILRYDTVVGCCFLLDTTFIDLYGNPINLKRKTQQITSYYSYNNLIRITALFVPNTAFFYSIESIFTNANWVEREASEMFGVFFANKKDTRKLLLDYTFLQHPLLKQHNESGLFEVFYDFFEEQVKFVGAEVVEL